MATGHKVWSPSVLAVAPKPARLQLWMATGRWAIIHNHETIGYAVVPTPASLQWDGSGSLGIRSKVLAPLAASG